MDPIELFMALVEANGAQDLVSRLPGAGNHAKVVSNTCGLRHIIHKLDGLSAEGQAAFTRSLAVYEQTVGGIGSPTLLAWVLPAIHDPDHKVFDWVLANTKSYDYYSLGARSYAQLQTLKAEDAARKAIRADIERKRVAAAKVRKAEEASNKLIKAVRRGDEKAVEALLRQGANPCLISEEGQSLDQLAEQLGRPRIAQIIRERKTAP